MRLVEDLVQISFLSSKYYYGTDRFSYFRRQAKSEERSGDDALHPSCSSRVNLNGRQGEVRWDFLRKVIHPPSNPGFPL